MALVEHILAPYMARPEAVVIDSGADVDLDSRTLMSLSLVLHELATNAAKYGALSVPGGRVHVSWRVEDANNQLRLRWVESGGPPVIPPVATGYGTKLIDSATTYSLGGEVEQDYAPGGLKTEIVIPLGSAPPAG
jgi:two-component sensor histidine kinase